MLFLAQTDLGFMVAPTVGVLIGSLLYVTFVKVADYRYTRKARKAQIKRYFSSGLPLPANIPQDVMLNQEEYSKVTAWSEENKLTTLEEITGSTKLGFIGQCILDSDPKIIMGYKEYEDDKEMYWHGRTHYLLTNKTMDDYVKSEDFWLCVFESDPAMGQLLLSLQSEEINSLVSGFLAHQLLTTTQAPKPQFQLFPGNRKRAQCLSIINLLNLRLKHSAKLRKLKTSRSLRGYLHRFRCRHTAK